MKSKIFNTELLQKEICEVISQIGGRITWTKEHGKLAKISYFIYKNEPKLNIEALFLGEKIGIIIHPPFQRIKTIYKSKSYKIFNVNNLDDFKIQFEDFRNEKLNK